MEHKSTDDRLNEIVQWQKDHERHDDRRDKENKEEIAKRPTKDEMEAIFEKVLIKYLITSGGKIRTGILVTASIVAGLVIIAGGAKWLLGLIGFTYMGK